MTQKEALAEAKKRGRDAWTRKLPEAFALGWTERGINGDRIHTLSRKSWEDALARGDDEARASDIYRAIREVRTK